MTVKELIALLSNAPLDMLVLVDGYESGFDNINSMPVKDVIGDHDPEDWNGKYRSCSRGGGYKALILSRKE